MMTYFAKARHEYRAARARLACLVAALGSAGDCGAARAEDTTSGGAAPASSAPSASPTKPPLAYSGPTVQLPPMLVEESLSSAPWLYVNTGDTEFLSRCSRGITSELVDAWMVQMQLLRVLVPEEFLLRMDVPTVFVLYAQDAQQSLSAEIQRELQEADPAHRSNFDVATSMRLADRDMHASIAYIDEVRFQGAGLSVSPEHVRYLLKSRVPELPTWLVDGFERTMRRADFINQPITLGPVVWINSTESSAVSDSDRPRTLLTPYDLFVTDAWEPIANQNSRRAEVRAATQELFVRWGLTSGPATRDAFWKFVSRATEAPVTDEMAEACFGFDLAELRDRLSDYLPTVVWGQKRIDPGTLPRLQKLQIERATPTQIARIRGEWERLAIGHVQRRLPQARGTYIAQARRTLHRAYDAGDRDPRLLATMGLCEIDSSNDSAARPFLEAAVAAGVVRPRAYFELARLRFGELRQNGADSFSAVELAPVFVPLHRGIKQSPPLPEMFSLLGEAWSRCTGPPEPSEWPDLELGARLFARRPAVALPIAQAYARHGRKKDAAALLTICAPFAEDDETKNAIAALRAGLPEAKP